jgi:hypothetical protein
MFAYLTIAVMALVQTESIPLGREEPHWLGVVVARGGLRDEIEATPILDRPYRPLHFYGNTVRRSYYRGTMLPNGGEVFRGVGLMGRRSGVPK